MPTWIKKLRVLKKRLANHKDIYQQKQEELDRLDKREMGPYNKFILKAQTEMWYSTLVNIGADVIEKRNLQDRIKNYEARN